MRAVVYQGPGRKAVQQVAFTVTVQDGVVTLAGRPENGEAGREIVRRIRHVRGMVAVRDRLSYPVG